MEDYDDIKQHVPSVEETLAALKLYTEGMPGSTIFYGLSNLTPEAVERIKPVWQSLAPEARARILNALTESSEENFELDYRAIGMLSLGDPDAAVRKAAIDVLWSDESLELMGRLIDITQWDEATEVRAAAASALGRFILLGELEDLPESEAARAQDAVVNLWNNPDEDLEVRRRALESIANCSHEIVNEAIDEAYHSHEQPMRVSAIFAMGRTYDKRWHQIILREIDSSDPEIRYEAARACGELEIARAIPRLARLAAGNDREIKEVAIWSLGEIGGKEAQRVLNKLAEEADEAGDEELLEAIEEAIGNATLATMLNFDLDDEDDLLPL